MGEKTLLEMAQALDKMERDVTSSEADILEYALKRLESGKKLEPKDETKLKAMYEKYLARDNKEEEGDDEGKWDVEGEVDF